MVPLHAGENPSEVRNVSGDSRPVTGEELRPPSSPHQSSMVSVAQFSLLYKLEISPFAFSRSCWISSVPSIERFDLNSWTGQPRVFGLPRDTRVFALGHRRHRIVTRPQAELVPRLEHSRAIAQSMLHRRARRAAAVVQARCAEFPLHSSSYSARAVPRPRFS